jgi:hypothetical protein
MQPKFLPTRLGLAAPALLCLPLFAQIQAPLAGEANLDQPLPKVPGSAIDGPIVTVANQPAEGQGALDSGAPTIERYAPADDSLPLPKPARFAPGEGQDTLLEAASGDPYFIGFVGGSLRPAAGERVEAALVERLLTPALDGRPHGQRYAYVMLDKRASAERLAELEALGARVLSFRPHQALAVALDVAALEALQASPAVRWIGAAPADLKLHPELFRSLAGKPAGERLELIVSLFEGDENPNTRVEPLAAAEVAGPGVRQIDTQRQGTRTLSRGWQQASLEALGAEVVEYLPSIRAQRVRMTLEQALAAARLDHVEFIEPELPSLPMHDDSQPMIGSDRVRAIYDGSWSGQAIAGSIDSGIDIDHTAMNHAWYLGWSLTGVSAWTDNCGHGTHVAGSILAQPANGLDELRGAAPGLGFAQTRSFRNVKFMEPNPDPSGNACIGAGGSSIEQRFSLMRDTWTNGEISSPRPHVINNSWGTGASTGGWVGSEANARTVDAEVWNENQVYVFAAGNSGPGASTLGQESSAKNAISVGNVVPYDDNTVGLPGNLWTSSSRGPCGDGRWKPTVTAPGRRIVSVDAHTGDGFFSGTGTSMAAPHVTGVIAQMVDHYDFLRYAPARVASVLCATANPKSGTAISGPGDAILDQHGAGRVDAERAANTDSQHGWNNWGFSLAADDSGFADFTVPAGVERLVVAMHYIEAAASAGASQALVNDFDLILDREPFAAGVDQGDFFAQQSSVDNIELRHFDNPTPGDWRWKVHPVSATSGVRMSVTVHLIYGDPTPNPTLALSADDLFVKPGETVELTATVSNSEHMASGVHVDTTNTTNADLLASTFVLGDGAVADLTDNPANNGGFDATLGNVRHGTSRSVTWDAAWDSQGSKTWSVIGTSDNGMNRNASLVVTVDGTKPGQVTNLQSSSHFPGQWSNTNNVQLVWTPATDNLSGIDGYGLWVGGSQSIPGTVKDIGAVSLTSTGPLASSLNGWWFNIRALDKSGNWSDNFTSVGPFLIDTVLPGNASGLVSTSHLTGVWSNDPNVDLQWLPAGDAHSGLAGYGWSWTSNAVGLPSQTQDLGAVTSVTLPLTSSTNQRYFNLRSVDEAGNWSAAAASAGPFLIDTQAPAIASFFAGNELGAVTQSSSPALTLYLAANDAHSGVAQMRLRNGGGVWSPWMAYQPSFAWDLTSFGGSTSTGTRLIYAELRDQAGNVTPAQTQVYYYQAPQIFGAPGIGAQGKPRIQVDGIPAVGQKFDVAVIQTNAPIKRLVLGASDSSYLGLPLPLDLGIIGSAGNTLLVAPELTLAEGLASSASVNVPFNTNLAGKTFYLQWLMFGDASGNTVVTSDAAAVLINGL